MSDETAATTGPADGGTTAAPALASGALLVAGVPFLVGGALVIVTDVPPSEAPRLGLLTHALWVLGIATLALGVAALLRRVDDLRRGLAGYLAAGVLGLGVLHGLQWLTWAYVDVRSARTADHDLVLESIIVPFGAGHLLVYAILVGTGVALLGWALRRTAITHRYVGWAGVVVGALAFATATTSLVSGFGGGSEGHVLFDVATLLLPLLYLWAMVLGFDTYRRR